MPNTDTVSPITGSPLSVPEPHGQAALLLVESLIHELCDKACLSPAEAVEIAERAMSVQADYAAAAVEGAPSLWRSHALLAAIAASLRTDLLGSFTSPDDDDDVLQGM